MGAQLPDCVIAERGGQSAAERERHAHQAEQRERGPGQKQDKNRTEDKRISSEVQAISVPSKVQKGEASLYTRLHKVDRFYCANKRTLEKQVRI